MRERPSSSNVALAVQLELLGQLLLDLAAVALHQPAELGEAFGDLDADAQAVLGRPT